MKENILDSITQLWVRVTGKRCSSKEIEWLQSPMGNTDVIGKTFIDSFAKEKGLNIVENKKDAGLLQNISDLGLDSETEQQLDNKIIDFYTKTSNYDFEIWSEWNSIFWPFAWLLHHLFSKRLHQLNLPLRPMDSSQGIESSIFQLNKNDKTKWTVWFRTLRATQKVIYAGIYSTTNAPNCSQRLLKVAFPLPNGAAVVVMKIEVKEDGSLLLVSDGKKYGQAGFYFTLRNKDYYRVRFVRSMHEQIHVYTDTRGDLRTDHKLFFWGLPLLTLHYKIHT